MKHLNHSLNTLNRFQLPFLKRLFLTLLLAGTFFTGQKVEAQTGGALNFTNGDYVELGSLSSLAFGLSDFTLETWFKTSMTNGTIMSKRSVCGTSNFWNIRISTGKIRFEMMEAAGANTVDLSTPLSYNDNTWHHVAVVRNGTIVKIIMDGYVVVNTNSAALTNLNNVTDPIKIGQSACSNFIGEIDETRIWTVARTACEIYASKGYQFNSTSSTLKFNAHYNQGSAGGSNSTITSLTNSASNAIPATLIGFALTGTTSNWVSSTCPAQGNTSTPVTTSTITSCGSYVWEGTTYTASGVYTNTFLVSNGCDSVAQLNLTINPLPSIKILASDTTICSGLGTPMVLTTVDVPTYCTPVTIYTGLYEGDQILNFEFANIKNNTLSFNSFTDPIYTYYSNIQANVVVGNTYTYNIQTQAQQTVYPFQTQQTAIWIDYNHDGDFNDPGEFAANNGYAFDDHTGSITIPSTALNGITRLRIGSKAFTLPNITTTMLPCGSSSNYRGEFEDYNIYISGGITPGLTCIWSPSNFLSSTNATTTNVSNITTTTTYTVTATDINGCTKTDTQTLLVNPLPTAPNIVSTQNALCLGEQMYMHNEPNYCTPTVSGGNINGQHYISQFSLSIGSTSLINNTSGDGVFSNFTSIIANLTATVSYNFTISQGGSASTGRAIWVDWNQDGDFSDNGEFVFASPSTSGAVSNSFTVPANAYKGTTRMRVAVSFNTTPTIGQSCSGFQYGEYEDYTVNITSNTSGFQWTPIGALQNHTTNTAFIYNQQSTTTYTLTTTDINGCINTDTKTITTINLPNVTATSSANPACAGVGVTLNGGGASTYTWTNGVTNGVSFTPTATTTYTVTGTSAGTSCSNTATITLEVIPFFTPNYTTPQTVCSLGSVTFAPPAYCTPSVANAYSANAYIDYFTFGAFSNLGAINFNTYLDYNSAPNAQNIQVNSGSSYTYTINYGPSLNPTNITNYAMWIDYNQNGIFESYEKVAGNSVGFSSSSSGSITIPLTALSGVTKMRIAAANQATFDACNNSGSGQYHDYNINIANSAQTVSWSPATYLNTVSGSKVNASAISSNITYTVTSSSQGCVGTKTITVNTIPKPTINISSSNFQICKGNATTLTGNGGVSYTWQPGNATTNAIVVNPTTTTNYTVTGTSANGCTNSSVATITVLQPVAVSTSSQNICSGNATTLIATNAATYSWQPGNLSGSSISVSPTATTTYTVTGTNALGCTSSTTLTINVNQCYTNLSLKLFIEGYYIGNQTMIPAKMNEGIGISTTDVDNITVELRNATPPYTLVTSTSADLKTNGSAVASFPMVVSGSFYIVVKHRSGLETWSANPVNLSTSIYDFTTTANKAYGSNQALVDVNTYAIYNGDINQDGNIDLLDATFLELDINNFEFGYFNTDLNGDGNVDLVDGPILENNVSNFIYSIHP